MRHVKLVLDILKKEKLYLSSTKLYFFEKELKLLGHVIDDEGVRMDPAKVDDVLKWKTPTNRDLLRTFLGAAGYLANNVPGVRVPMGHLSKLVGDTVPFRWHATEQRAFEEVKDLIQTYRNHHRVTLKYGDGQPPINVVTDGCATGIAGLVSQGEDWQTAPIAAFYSAKLNSAQQNYAVHEIELLAGVETMLRHRNILQGAKFIWYTDHKALIHLLKQKNLTGRQARWMEKISEFDFEVVYVSGSSNVLADALSRIYSNDESGTVRARSEYTEHDDNKNDMLATHEVSMPLLVGLEARAASLSDLKNREGGSKKQRLPDGLDTPVPGTGRGCRKRRAPGDYARLNEGVDVSGERSSDDSSDTVKRTERVVLEVEDPVVRQEGGSVNKPDALKNKPSPEPEPIKTREEVIPSETAHDFAETLIHDFIDSLAPVKQIQTWMAPGLIEVIADGTPSFNLPFCLRNRYEEDPFFKNILEAPKEYKNFELEGGLIFLKVDNKRLLCIPRIVVEGRSAQEVVISHAHSLLAHLGAHKTLIYLRDHVWWKQMSNDVHKYCESCIVCRKSKPNNQKPYGLLNPLPVPVRPWEAIGIDFVGPLPVSKNRNGEFDTITVIIDLLTAMVHLVPSRQDFRAKDVADLVFDHVYKLHGLPKAIVSDRDSLFTSTFWKHLHKLIGVELRMSSAYHPETDGSTERANRTVTQMLRQCVRPDQKDWVTKLPAIEFAINSARSESTGYAPFFLNTGRMPRSMIWDSADKTEYPGVRTYAQKMKEAIMTAHDSILAARVKQIRAANRQRRPAPFKEGDLVYLSSKDLKIPKGRARKLIPKYIGPYKILKAHRNDSFVIELPPELKRRGIHGVFHSSKLRIHIPNDDRLFPGRLVTQVTDFTENSKEWAVERIVSHKGAGTNAHFEVEWKSGDRTWMPYDQVAHLNALNAYFEVLGIDRVSELKRGSGNPPDDDPQVFFNALRPARLSKAVLNDGNWEGDPVMVSQVAPNSAMQDNVDLLADHPYFRFRGEGYICRSPDAWKLIEFSRKDVEHILVQSAMKTTVDKGDGKPVSLPDRYMEFAVVYNQWDEADKVVGTNNEPVAVPAACTTEAENARSSGVAFEPGDPAAVPFPEPGEVMDEEGGRPSQGKARARSQKNKRPKPAKAGTDNQVDYLTTVDGQLDLLRDVVLIQARTRAKAEMRKITAMEERRKRRRDRNGRKEERRKRPPRGDGPSKASGSAHEGDDRMVE
jgi:transposase InsO family protein